MYEFIDVTEQQPEGTLPAEAASINGEYIENKISGYRTLNVQGRETYLRENVNVDLGLHDGSFLAGRHYPAREIVVTFQMLADTDSAYRLNFEKLNSILDVENAKLIFNDESDRYYIGTPSEAGEIEAGSNSVIGEFTITCHDPFKYSVQEYEATAERDSSGNDYFLINYDGDMPSHPVLEAEFFKSTSSNNQDGDCGYVAFVNDGKTLQFGDPNEADTKTERASEYVTNIVTSTQYPQKEIRLWNQVMNSANVALWSKNDGYKSNNAVIIGGAVATNSSNEVYPSSYGSGSNLHGPTMKVSIPNPTASMLSGSTAAARSVNGQLYVGFKLYSKKDNERSDTDTGFKSSGGIGIWLLNSSGGMIAGVNIIKNANRDYAKINLYINGLTPKSYENIPCVGSESKLKNAGLNLYKTGGSISINCAGYSYSGTNSALANVVPAQISIGFYGYGSAPTLQKVAVSSVSFTDKNVKFTVPKTETTQTLSYWSYVVDKENTFSTNDLLVADTGRALVQIGDAYSGALVERPSLGALGNDWDGFALTKGANYIGTGYSSWVTDAHRPTFRIKYRKVYI